jgi:hypothetical protein
LSLFSQSFTPKLSLSILVFGTLLSALWEEIGWTGYAIPRMLKSVSTPDLENALVPGLLKWSFLI